MDFSRILCSRLLMFYSMGPLMSQWGKIRDSTWNLQDTLLENSMRDMVMYL